MTKAFYKKVLKLKGITRCNGKKFEHCKTYELMNLCDKVFTYSDDHSNLGELYFGRGVELRCEI